MYKSLFGILFSFFQFSCETIPEQKVVYGYSNDSDSFSDTSKKHQPLLQDLFLGTIRADVKTSFVNFVADTFESIKELHAWLPSDVYMHKSTDAKHNDTPRTKEESHNVYLHNLYIFGVKREDDNDYHVVLGSYKSIEKQQAFFTAEISGLPDTASAFFNKLCSVRTIFKNYFGEDAKKEYVFVATLKNPPILIDYICGSLFYDNHHFGGHSSIQGYQVCSAWEIHPVTDIRFHRK